MLDLNKIRGACEAATPGPWRCGPLEVAGTNYHMLAFQDAGNSWNNDLLCSWNAENDAQLCVHARTWLPALVEELREARAEIERLRAFVPPAYLLRELAKLADKALPYTLGGVPAAEALALAQRIEEANIDDRT